MGKDPSSVSTIAQRDIEQASSSQPINSDSTSSSSTANSRTPFDVEERHEPTLKEPFVDPKWLRRLNGALPLRLRKYCHAIGNYCTGPKPPRIWKIRPVFPSIQHAPLRLLGRVAPKRIHRFWLLVALYFVWLLCFITILRYSAFDSEVPEYGSASTIACTASYWADKNGCGLNGNDCRPFQNSSFAFRCSANCLKALQLNPHAVGATEVNYKPLVVGGPTNLSPDSQLESAFYRADSFICGAAIHAGYITDSQGGCGALRLIGTKSNFPSVKLNGIESVGFDSSFPMAFQFVPGSQGDCKDLRWPLLAVSVILTSILGLFTTSPAVFFWSIFCSLFFHCALVSDPPDASDYYGLVSIAFGRFLPAAFVAAIMYQFVVRRTLTGLTAQVEKVILWLGACWVGVLDNNTFDKIPIQRLTGHDLQQQPGAITALVIIIIVLAAIIVGQAWVIRREGNLPRYLALYLFMGFCLGMLAAIPGMNLRIHHYILGLLLLPGTRLQTRLSLLYQGLLIGLFIDGVARWDFDSIVQTSAALQGDATLGSDLPAIVGPTIAAGSNITFGWPNFPDNDYDGLSVLVNDVERFRHYVYDGAENFTWARKAPAGDPEYFRFAFMSGSTTLDYTMAGIWDANGNWTAPAEGPSK